MKLNINDRSYEIEVQSDAVVVGGVSFKTSMIQDNGEATIRVAGRPYKVKIKDEKTVVVDGRHFTVELIGRATNGHKAPKAAKAKASANCADKGAVRAPMPGTVLSLRVKEGDQIATGGVLLILEAMKMQNEIKAPLEGTVKRILVTPGQTVNSGDVMVVIE